MVFNDETDIRFNLGSHVSKTDLLEDVRDLSFHPGSGGNIEQLLHTVRRDVFLQTNGERSSELNMLVIVTDGLSSAGSNATIAQALLAKQEGIHIITVGVGLSGQTQEVDAIASAPADVNRYLVMDFLELESIVPKLITHICRGIFFVIFQSHCLLHTVIMAYNSMYE